MKVQVFCAMPAFVAGAGKPSPTKLVLTANIEASDGGKAIVAGNERVIRARLCRRQVFLREQYQG